MKWSNFRYPSIYLTPICNMYYYICTRSINQFFRRRYIYNRMCHVAYDYYPECSCNNLTNLFLLSLRVLRVRLFLITLFLQLFHKIEHLESFRTTITYEVSRNSEFIFIRQNRTDIGIHEFFFITIERKLKKNYVKSILLQSFAKKLQIRFIIMMVKHKIYFILNFILVKVEIRNF